MEEQHITKLAHNTMYMNLHTIVFPDTDHSDEKIKMFGEKHNALSHYKVQGLANVIFAKKIDAMAFYFDINGEVFA